MVWAFLIYTHMQLPNEEELHEIVDRLDEILHDYKELGTHNLAGVLLSRVVLLMEDQPALGKDLVRYVWEQLDRLEQENLGGNFDF